MNPFAYLLNDRPIRVAGQLFLVLAASLLIALSAKVSIPFYPVSMTMQTAVILALSLAVGATRAGLIVGCYLLEGAVGLPVFTGTPERGIGLAYMLGPTGGYLLGFFVAAVACGYLADRGWGKSFPKACVAAALGTVCVFVPGLAWLAVLVGWSPHVLEVGLYPFAWAAVLKTLLAAAAGTGVRRIVGGRAM